jgi:PAS domain S-box-containing protein
MLDFMVDPRVHRVALALGLCLLGILGLVSAWLPQPPGSVLWPALEATVLGALLVLTATLFVPGSRRREGLEEVSRKLARVVKDTKVGLWYWELATGELETTDEWKALLGLSPDTPSPNPEQWWNLLYGEDRTRYYQEIEDLLESNETERHIEIRVVHPDQSVHWLLISASVERNAAGKALRLSGSILDVTERRRLEAEKAALSAQMLQAQKTEALGRLAGGIAHDLNNLLVPILAYSELGATGQGNKSATEYFTKIKGGVERAAALTRQILAFSRQQVLERRPLDLNKLVSEFEVILGRTIREDIRFRVDLGPDLPAILADPGQVEQVILNLVVNARDAMPEGGDLTLETRYQVLDAGFAAARAGSKPGPYVVLSVADTGSGMTDEVKSRIFEPFFTTKARGEGTGLGLSTVQGIVQQHGGHLSVYSELGHGTVILVFWPLADSAAADPRAETETPAGGTETLLVVEDDFDVRSIITEGLVARGYRVLPCLSPEAALAVTEPIDLLVTDVVMPGLNGRELYRALRQSRPQLRVLFVSGHTDRILTDHGEDPGQGFLQKPFTVQRLASKVRTLLDG